MATETAANRQRLSAAMRQGEQVTPLELFFDLVFVLALTQCTQLMSNARPGAAWLKVSWCLAS